ncbi:ATP-grasp domain-containing protein [Skermanella pratensis]|uniref:ATP-grasp domain-containing protein n=1 Tax=Skermanella pratensis TaxID=2233999 RepID=UPI00178890B1|nr:ATP-grasp domain-containing protein [Skermanella pratensis]
MTAKIALFANQDSAQIAEIAAEVTALGAEPVVMDIQIGRPGKPTVGIGAPGSAAASRWGDVDFGDIRAVHIRCTAPRTLPVLPPVLNEATYSEYRVSYIQEQALNAATYGFFEHLHMTGRLVINRLTSAYVDHNSKGQFYEKLRAAGFRAPRSLSTSCPDEAARFLDEVGEAVVKPAIGVGSTRSVTAEDRARLDELLLCPALFQHRVPGSTIRIHIVGDRVVLPLRILADGVDSRTATRGFEPVTLDPAEEAAIVRANQALGLHYAAWDAILDDDGKLTYLDCNPGPFVMWLPPEHRHTVFGALARYLVAFARTGTLEAAA